MSSVPKALTQLLFCFGWPPSSFKVVSINELDFVSQKIEESFSRS